MAIPIYGPTYVNHSDQFTSTNKMKYRQTRPYDRPLPYSSSVATSIERGSTNYWQVGPKMVTTSYVTRGTYVGQNSFTRYNQERTHAINQAYERLKGKVKSQSGWAENIAQASSARDMFNNRAGQMWDIVKFLGGRGRPTIPPTLRQRQAAVIGNKEWLSDNALNRLRARKDVAKTFLEVEYGWRPLLNDIGESIKLMCSDPPFGFVKAGAKSAWNESSVSRSGDMSKVYSFYKEQKQIELYIQMGAVFVVSNPNVFLANSLGFIDPALPWKLMPYSFVVDWFVNVEQVISSISDWFGLTINQPYTSQWAKTSSLTYSYSQSKASIGVDLYNNTSMNRIAWASEMSRTLGLTGPSLIVKPFRGFSIERGAQAISLIVASMR